MKTFFFHLMPYGALDLSYADRYNSAWVTLPNSYFDPADGEALYRRYIDELELADALGFDGICVNEHHQNAYGLMPAPNLIAAVLARTTKRAKIAILGRALPLVGNPVNIAEEFAMLDQMSGGRIITGFVRGIGCEYFSNAVDPTLSHERFYEAHDLILKAWTTHDGPFNFEGRWYHHRTVNIWPRPYQQPHPPVWVTIGSAGTAVPVAEHQYIGAVFLAGYQGIRKIYDGYRKSYSDKHGKEAPLDRLAYCSLIHVNDSPKSARDGAEKILWYMTSNKVPPHFSNPPGYHPPPVAAQIMRGGRGGAGLPLDPKLDDQMARGNVFAGTPDQVFNQIKAFWEYSGGFGNLLMMGQAGFLTYDDAVKSMHLFATEVYPRLKELTASYDPDRMKAARAAQPDRAQADTSVLDLAFAR